MQNQPQTKPMMLTSQGSQTLSALEKWQPQDPVPATKAELSTVISALSEQMKPASEVEYAKAMKALIEFASAFQIPCQKPEIVHAIYREQLVQLPADLLHLAIDRIKAQWIWRTQMPFPADIRNKISEEWAKRKVLLNRAKLAEAKATDPKRPTARVSPNQVSKTIRKTTSDLSLPSSMRAPEEMSHEEASQQLEKDRAEFARQYFTILDAG